jgi:ribosome biogenesis GTPase
LTICFSSGIEPIIVLSKVDLINKSSLEGLLTKVNSCTTDIPSIAISNESREGYNDLFKLLKGKKTYCLLGSSGVGKSTLLNNLSGEKRMKTEKISDSTKKGRHITSHRELIIVKNGAILIDNPGMREIGVTESTEGLEMTFDKIIEASRECRFKDCSHTNESGCAVLKLVQNGEIDSASYENYLKMEREKSHFELTSAEKRKKDKAFGKMLKNYKSDIQKISSKHNNSFNK